MKVKYIKKDDTLWLEYLKIYNIFSVLIWKWGWEKYYINNKESKYVYPFDIKDFIIVNWSLPDYWSFWINEFWDYILWPKEVYEMKDFWDNYYNDEDQYLEIINNYK